MVAGQGYGYVNFADAAAARRAAAKLDGTDPFGAGAPLRCTIQGERHASVDGGGGLQTTARGARAPPPPLPLYIRPPTSRARNACGLMDPRSVQTRF